MNRMITFEQISRYRKAYKNWVSVMLNLYLKREPVKVTLRNGYKTEFTPTQASIFSFSTKIGVDPKITVNFLKKEKVPYKNKAIIMHGLASGFGGDVPLTFFNEDYKFLNIKGQVVIDIGANIGDTAVYFALNGAKQVIALEPYPATFRYAVQNIKENGLDNQILLLNAGYGKDEEVIVEANTKDTTGTLLRNAKDGIKIKVFSLESLIKAYDIKGAILKMDCEGCEYNLLNENDQTLMKFKQIQIEFHYGYKNLAKKLECSGFNVKQKILGKINGNVPELKRMALENKDNTSGYIYAELT
ncbi:MAG: FkbM family methyltransferase [Candidatus Parvarchaeota archaeon]